MNGIKLNSIEGLVPEIKTSHLDPVFFEKEQAYLDTDEKQRIFAEGFNRCLKQQGNREIYQDREKLAEKLHESEFGQGYWEILPIKQKDKYYFMANYLILNQSQIIKSVV